MYAEREMHCLYNIKIISAQQAKGINLRKNIRFKLLKINASICFKKTCKNLTIDSQIRTVPHQRNISRIPKTRQEATKFRINQELKFLYKKKQTLNEQLHRVTCDVLYKHTTQAK
jgi:hypothetical protein